jgi:hypothetical protein
MLWGSSILVKSAWCPGGFLHRMGTIFSRFKKSSVIILLNILLIPLLVPVRLLQCPWFSGLVFWWGLCFLIYSFLRTWVVWLIILQFFLYLPFHSSSEILSSAYSSLLEWTSILFRISVSFFFLKFSISCVTSSLLLCIFTFNSFISLFIVLFHFGV